MTIGAVGQPVVTRTRPCACGGSITAIDVPECIVDAVRFHNDTDTHRRWRDEWADQPEAVSEPMFGEDKA